MFVGFCRWNEMFPYSMHVGIFFHVMFEVLMILLLKLFLILCLLGCTHALFVLLLMLLLHVSGLCICYVVGIYDRHFVVFVAFVMVNHKL